MVGVRQVIVRRVAVGDRSGAASRSEFADGRLLGPGLRKRARQRRLSIKSRLAPHVLVG